MTEQMYHDSDWNECTLDTLCRVDPGWAANAIRQLRVRAELAEEQRDRARAELQESVCSRCERRPCEDHDEAFQGGAGPACGCPVAAALADDPPEVKP